MKIRIGRISRSNTYIDHNGGISASASMGPIETLGLSM